MSNHVDDIEPAGDGQWKVRAERRQGDRLATGEALVRGDGTLHRALAGARAWLALAQAQVAAGDTAAATEAARAGLAELGDQYAAPNKLTIDDTRLQVDLAAEQLKRGQPADAARRLLRVLETRLTMYTSAHAEALAE